MKLNPLVLAAVIASGVVTGCQHLDLAPESDPQRAIDGTVNLRTPVLFPPEAVLSVRVIDTSPPMLSQNPLVTETPALSDRQGNLEASEHVLGEQVIHAPGAAPIPFRIEFAADDTLMRHGLTLEARVFYDGKVRYRSIESSAVTLSSSRHPLEIWIEPVQ